MKYAPILLFTYNRPQHTKRTLEALKRNFLASYSELFIFSDGPKNDTDSLSVKEVRKLLKKLTGFKHIEIITSNTNKGLANSIVGGVTEVINKYGRVIVLEDDLIVSSNFLNFMNEALDKYKNEDLVWHVSGWNYPIETEGMGDVFFWRVMNCWGWATWRDRWIHFRKDPLHLLTTWNKKEIRRFNLEGANDFWAQVVENAEGKIDTWAIFWYATIFENGGLCLNPTRSYVKNIGCDGSGINCSNSPFLGGEIFDPKYPVEWPTEIQESEIAVRRIKDYYRKYVKVPFRIRLKNSLINRARRFPSYLMKICNRT